MTEMARIYLVRHGTTDWNSDSSTDLRAPLRAIDGFSKMLLSDAKSLEEDSRRKLKIVRENTEKMNRLIDDLLNLSRLGRQVWKPSNLNMGKIFRESWDELCQSTPERKGDLEIRRAFPPGAQRRRCSAA